MGEDNIFSLCLSSHLDGGTPCQVWIGGYPSTGLYGGGTPSQIQMGGPHLRSRQGVYPIQDPAGGTSSHPIPGLDGGYHILLTGGYPHSRSGWGYPGTRWDTPHPGLDGVPLHVRRQISIASTCYAAGDIPLAFTQEDFLFWNVFNKK